MKIRDIITFLGYAVIATAAIGYLFLSYQNFLTSTRGVSYRAPGSANPEMRFGVNADLDQYNDSDLARALEMIRDTHATIVRQHFYWTEIEPQQGQFNWGKWDRIVAGANRNNLDLVAVIDTTPEWARHLGERDLPNARPNNPEDYAQFAATFTRRYPDVRYIQIWDNPNVHPFWGRRIVDPMEYTALLRGAAISIRAVNPNVKILSAGLAPNSELIRGHADYSDVLFLRGMYDTGAREYFDIVGAKPYGMWSGPDDRRVDKDVFNFSRAIVLHDEMVTHGDANKPMWAVEFGWNSLPNGWEGKPSPWGSDSEAVQSARLYDAVQRAKSEWQPWMSALIAQTFQPNAPSDDAIWGFALVDRNFQSRASYSALARAIAAPTQPATFDFIRFYFTLALLAMIAAVSVWRGFIAARQILWDEYWRAIEYRFAVLPQFTQYALLIAAVIAFYLSRITLLNFALLALITLLFALRLDLSLAITVFTIPFYLQTKNLVGSAEFSLVELLTTASVAGLALKQMASGKRKRKSFSLKAFRSKLSALDWAVIFFVLAGLVSVQVAANFGVANREFRVIVLEPALMYALVRTGDLEMHGLRRLTDSLILSALALSLLGLYQFWFTNYVIIGEGVRRILSVYGSPNNLALYLDRVLPMLIALIVFDTSPTFTQKAVGRRIFYTLAAIPIALCLYWTYSRAALLFAMPAGLAAIAFASGRRARITLGALLIGGLIALVPFMQTERWQSLFQEGTGTGFFRVSVWQSAVEMILDHPIFGVGLDNFLYEYPKYIKPDAWREPNLSHPHNIALDFWARMGIPGLIVLVLMVGIFFRDGLRALVGWTGERRDEGRAIIIALMAGMTATLAHGMVDAAYFFVDLAFIWMVMLAVCTQVSKEANK